MGFKTTEKAQALVLIALVAVGLFAFAALALDGSAVFSDRRHAQNAADTGAYAAALAKVRGKSEAEWKQAGLDRVESNGYINDGVDEVKVYSCLEWKTSPDNPGGSDCQGLPSGAKPEEYIYVRIKSVVNTYFARVIGRQQITNYTDAIVHASPMKETEWFDGKALVAANTKCAAPGDFGPFDAGGSGNTVVTNSGVFVNSSCSEAFEDNGSGNSMVTDTGICIVGGIKGGYNDIVPPPDANCGTQIDIYQYWMPDSDPTLLKPYCDPVGSITGSGGDYIATPGHFGGGAFPDKSPSGTLRLQKGIYCFDSGVSLNAGWELTTDLNDNGVFDPSTEGVFFYVRNGDFTLNGGATIKLYAMTNTDGGFPSQLLDYLIYVPASNVADIVLTGDGDSTFTGMVLAPTSNIDIKGNSTGLDLHTQIISLNTRISGNGTVDITYDPNDIPPAITMPKLSPTE